MRKLINNPKVVGLLVGMAAVFFLFQYLPPDWHRRWENWLLGEAARLAVLDEPAAQAEGDLPKDRLLSFRPAGLSTEWRSQVSRVELARTMFPQVADLEENRRLVLEQRIPILPQGLRLDGIYLGGDRRTAMLSGILLGEGDFFQNVKVLRIEENGVVFQIGSLEKKLELGETVPMMPKSPRPEVGGETPAGPAREAGDPVAPLLEAEQERLRKLQELGTLPAKLLEGSKQFLPQILPSNAQEK